MRAGTLCMLAIQKLDAEPPPCLDEKCALKGCAGNVLRRNSKGGYELIISHHKTKRRAPQTPITSTADSRLKRGGRSAAHGNRAMPALQLPNVGVPGAKLAALLDNVFEWAHERLWGQFTTGTADAPSTVDALFFARGSGKHQPSAQFGRRVATLLQREQQRRGDEQPAWVTSQMLRKVFSTRMGKLPKELREGMQWRAPSPRPDRPLEPPESAPRPAS